MYSECEVQHNEETGGTINNKYCCWTKKENMICNAKEARKNLQRAEDGYVLEQRLNSISFRKASRKPIKSG